MPLKTGNVDKNYQFDSDMQEIQNSKDLAKMWGFLINQSFIMTTRIMQKNAMQFYTGDFCTF